jgi:hypothetical protein
MVGSPSYINTQTSLSNQALCLAQTGEPLNLVFSEDKTEVIHWAIPCQKIPPPIAPFLLNRTLSTPCQKVKWPGSWFDIHRHPSTSLAAAASAAITTLTMLCSLASFGKGITSCCVYRLVTQVIQPKILYSVHLFTPTITALKRLNLLWHQAARWILGAFRTTPISSLLVEACLPPIQHLFRAHKLRYVYRIACLDPSPNNTISALLGEFPTALPFCNPHTSRLLCGHRIQTSFSKWTNTKPPSHCPLLTIDKLAQSLLPWTIRSFPLTAYSPGPRPLAHPILPNKETFDPDNIFLTLPPPNSTLLFSDGSLSFLEDNQKEVDTAFVYIQGDTPICESVHPLPPYWGIFDAELYGAYQVLLYATTFHPPPPAIYLHLDNQAAIYTITCPSRSSSALTIHKLVAALTTLKSNNTEVHIGWTLGHIGIIGNELADKAAKCAAPLPYDDSLPWTPTGIRPDLRAQLLRDWTSDYTIRTDYSYSPLLDLNPIFDLPRMQAIYIFQMRLGQLYLLAHPIWFRPDPANCPRCDLDLETTEHAILHCPERQYARDLFPKDLDLNLAWISPDQLKIIGDFIICTQTGYPPLPTPL